MMPFRSRSSKSVDRLRLQTGKLSWKNEWIGGSPKVSELEFGVFQPSSTPYIQTFKPSHYMTKCTCGRAKAVDDLFGPEEVQLRSGFQKRPPPFWPSARASEASPVRKEFGVIPSFESSSCDLHGPSSPVHPTPQTEYQSSPTSSKSDNMSKMMDKSQLRSQKLATKSPDFFSPSTVASNISSMTKSGL